MSKKLFFFISFSMFIICKGKAQVNTSSKLKIGLKTGLNLSTFTKDVSVFDQGNYANFQKYFRIASLIGVVTKYHVSAPFSWGAELLYNQRGSAYRQENGSVVIVTNQGTEKAYNYFKFKINYLELPLTANCNLSTHSKGTINFSIYGGLAPAIVLIRKTSYDSYDSNDNSPVANSTSESGELKDVRPFNISTVAGFEIAGKKEGSFFFNGRISNTLLPVFQQATSSDGHNMKTRMWSYTLGLGVYLDYSSK
jgi:hypothetical protein